MAEDIVVVVHDWNEGEAVPIQCLWLLLVDCWGEKSIIFSLCGTWTDSISTWGCVDVPFQVDFLV